MDIGQLNFLLSVIFIKLWHFIHDTKNAAKSLLLISQRILKAELIDFDSFCIFLYHQRWLEHVRLSLNAEQGKIIQRSRQVCFDVNVASTHPSLKLIKTNICLCTRNLNDTFYSRMRVKNLRVTDLLKRYILYCISMFEKFYGRKTFMFYPMK